VPARSSPASPTPAALHTWNASENAPMIAVNTKLGFRPIAQLTTWERELP